MIVALGDRVIIKKKERQKKTGILLLEDPKTDFEITHVGEDVTKVNVGDTVFPNPYSIVEFDFENTKYWCVEEKHIFAKISPQE